MECNGFKCLPGELHEVILPYLHGRGMWMMGWMTTKTRAAFWEHLTVWPVTDDALVKLVMKVEESVLRPLYDTRNGEVIKNCSVEYSIEAEEHVDAKEVEGDEENKPYLRVVVTGHTTLVPDNFLCDNRQEYIDIYSSKRGRPVYRDLTPRKFRVRSVIINLSGVRSIGKAFLYGQWNLASVHLSALPAVNSVDDDFLSNCTSLSSVLPQAFGEPIHLLCGGRV